MHPSYEFIDWQSSDELVAFETVFRKADRTGLREGAGMNEAIYSEFLQPSVISCKIKKRVKQLARFTLK
jgi:hypothetical protein